jgi:hypothetical protein
MRSQLIRPLLVIVFLVAIDACLTFWSEVGGQYDLDLMFWPWKFGLTLAAAGLITAITAELVRGVRSRRMVLYGALLIAVVLTAGVVTYYYYLNEPTDDNGDAPASQTTRLEQFRYSLSGTPFGSTGATASFRSRLCRMSRRGVRRTGEPDYQTLQAFAGAIGCPAVQLKAWRNSGIFCTTPLARS